MRTVPKGLRILRVARETTGESSSIRAGVTPGRTASDHFLVSRATRKILSPFWGARMYSLSWPGLGECAKSSALSGVPPLASWPAPGLAGGTPERGEDFSIRSRNGEVNGTGVPKCHTWTVGVRSLPRFSRDTRNPHPFLEWSPLARPGLEEARRGTPERAEDSGVPCRPGWAVHAGTPERAEAFCDSREKRGSNRAPAVQL